MYLSIDYIPGNILYPNKNKLMKGLASCFSPGVMQLNKYLRPLTAEIPYAFMKV